MLEVKRKFRSIVLIGLLVLVTGTGLSAHPRYPLRTNVTLTWWMELHANVALVAKNFGDTEFAKELQKRTGVRIKFLHPPLGQAKEAFDLMLASGDLPDIIEYNWFDIPGGPNSALENGYILRLNPIMNRFAPHLKRYLKKHPVYDKMVKTDEGNYYVFPFIRGSRSLVATSGPLIREDWLDELGLGIPETLDDWYGVLKAFKEKKGADPAFTCEATGPGLTGSTVNQTFEGGMDSYRDFYVDHGKVRYGSIEPQRKQYFALMNKWYHEGLIDKNFGTNTRKAVDANILSGKSGACYGSGGSGLGRYMAAMAGKKGSFRLIGAPFPTPQRGKLPRFSFLTPPYGPKNNGSAAITARCRNIEAAARLLDYAYSPEGSLFYNFGIRGLTFRMVRGYPAYTRLILKNPDGLADTMVMSNYLRGHTNGPFVQDRRYLEQYYQRPEQKAAIRNWSKTDFARFMMPPVTPTPGESEELSQIMNDINAFNDEMTMKFIMGVEPVSGFDRFVAQMKRLGIDRAIQIYQRAYSRYLNR